MNTALLLASFGVVALASAAIGDAFKRIQLPAITGYLFAGAIAGSFALDLIPSSATEDLRFVDEIALAVIAFVAGSELYIKEIRPRLKPILSITSGIILVAYALLTVGIFLLTDVVSFTRDLDTGARLATALLGAAVLLALSPPSTIAVIKDVRARGRFTRTVLGVTITMDVAIIVLFATMTSIASPLLTNSSLDLSFILLLALDLFIAVVLGVIAGQILRLIMSLPGHQMVKIALVLATGFGIYELADFVSEWSPDALGFEIYIEPLLIALIAGFIMTNFTAARDDFADLLHVVGPTVYIAFFTLTGLSLKLDILWTVLPVAVALFVLRAIGIAGGTWLGSRWAGEAPRHRRVFWAAFITQAGIALGLAREVAVQFPSLGDAFATLIISVVVINEVVGPLFLKAGLRRVGETHEPDRGTAPSRRAVVLGVESQSLELARALQRMDWEVVVADTDEEHVARLAAADVDERHIPDVSEATIRELMGDNTDAVVAMLGDDDANARILDFATDLGVQRLVARPADPGYNGTYEGIEDLLVVDPGTAIVSLLEQAVTSPQSATLLLRQDADRLVTQLEITNPDLAGTPVRDLRLPTDVLLLQLTRNGSTVVVHGHTELQFGDEITVLAGPDSIDEARIKLTV
ncbi:MAG: cation:proton antiporter [Acidimicrobiia bacterium]|nr:cation:proton antiporter [Acidimicrobiia bacterium]